MLKKRVVLKKRRMSFERFDYRTFFFLSLFISGLIMGIFLIKDNNTEFNNLVKQFFLDYIANKKGSVIFKCFSDNLILVFSILLLTFVSGLCAVGAPMIIAIPTFLGIFVGMAIAILYSEFTLQGLGYCALIIIPGAAIVTATLLKCCNESINMAIEIVYLIVGGNRTSTRGNELKEYCLKYLVLCVPFIIAALLNTVTLKLFGNLFSFV